MNSELRDILFLDIETVATTDNFNALDERLKTQWARKASFLKREETITDEELFHQRAGIYAEFGKIICIVVGKLYEKESGEIGLKTKAFFDHNEKNLLTDFKAMLEKMEGSLVRLCAHNGKEFDFPYISRRMLINGLTLPSALNLSGRNKHYTSLDLLAAIFNIPSSKSDMDGSQVNGVYYKEKNLEKIKDYCVNDVIVLAQLFLKLKGQTLVSTQNIVHTV
jgi:3'-5' exonuclease